MLETCIFNLLHHISTIFQLGLALGSDNISIEKTLDNLKSNFKNYLGENSILQNVFIQNYTTGREIEKEKISPNLSPKDFLK